MNTWHPGDTVIVPAHTYRWPIHATIITVTPDEDWGDSLYVEAANGDRWSVHENSCRPHTPDTCRLDTHCTLHAQEAAA